MTDNQRSVHPGYSIPGWKADDLAYASFSPNGGLACPIPGCKMVFNETHGPRYTVEKWKAHVMNKDMHYYLWYDSAACYQPKALANTFIRIDKTYRIAVCHYRREPVHPKKLDDHCKRCRGCLYVDHRYMDDPQMADINHISEQDLFSDRLAVQGFEACEAYYCCQKLYGPSQQGIHSHLKSKRQHNPSPPVKCMRYRTSRHGYAYIPINDVEYNKLSNLSESTVVAGLQQTDEAVIERSKSRDESEGLSDTKNRSRNDDQSQTEPKQNPSQNPSQETRSEPDQSQIHSNESVSGHHTFDSFQQQVLSQEYQLFQNFYDHMIKSCIEKLDNITWKRHSAVAADWVRIIDQPNIHDTGYSILSEKQNSFNEGKGVLWNEISAAGAPDSSTPPFIRQVCKGSIETPDHQSIERYFQVCHDLARQLAVLVYTAIPTITDVETLIFANYANDEHKQRQIFVNSEGRVTLLKQEMPWIIGELLLRYLIVARPMQIELAKLIMKDNDYVDRLKKYIFVGGIATPITPEQFDQDMNRYTEIFLDRSVSTEVWNQLLSAMIENARAQSFTSEAFCEGWYNTTGLVEPKGLTRRP